MKLSLRWKIMGGFGLMLLFIALLGWVTLSLFGSVRSVQRKVFRESIPALVAVDEIVRSYTAQSAAVRGSLIGSLDALLDRYQREVEVAKHWETQARELLTDGRESELLDNLTEAGSQFHSLVDEEVIPKAVAGNRAQAFLILDQDGSRLIQDIEVQGELLRTLQEQRLQDTENELSSRSRQALIILVIVLVGVGIAGIALAFLLPQRLSRNISRLVEATRAIGRGDFEHDVGIHSGDEVEELATRFTEMQAGLQRLQQLALQDRELEIAASIQRNLLIRHIPHSPGLKIIPMQRQANLVGGDWYDIDVTPRAATVVVGDASGKGIAAALMATVALSFLRAEKGLGSLPKTVIARTNEALLDATDPDSFTTAIYSVIDIASGEARWLNMGHPAPFLLRPPRAGGTAGGGTAGGGGTGVDGDDPRGYYLEGPRNRVLGWFEDPGLNVTVIQMSPGDRLIFYTDGFLEAKSPEGEVFGEQRLAEAIVRLSRMGTDQLGELLVGEVERFAAGKLDDDLTMLIVEYEGAVQQDDGSAATLNV